MTTKEFIQYASERPELCEKMSACTEAEEAYAIARGEGLTDDMEIFTEVMTKAKAEAEKLSEADLESVQAAGSLTADVVTVAVGTVAAAGAAGV